MGISVIISLVLLGVDGATVGPVLGGLGVLCGAIVAYMSWRQEGHKDKASSQVEFMQIIQAQLASVSAEYTKAMDRLRVTEDYLRKVELEKQRMELKVERQQDTLERQQRRIEILEQRMSE